MEKKLLEISNSNEVDAGDKSSLREVFKREVNFGEPSRASGFNDVDDAVDGAEGAV